MQVLDIARFRRRISGHIDTFSNIFFCHDRMQSCHTIRNLHDFDMDNPDRYTSGRWRWNEKERLSRRRVV
jgi:hypothetical protein